MKSTFQIFKKIFKKIFKNFQKSKIFKNQKFTSCVSIHNQNLLCRSISLFNKIYQYNNPILKKNIELFYKKYSLILQYRFLQNYFKQKLHLIHLKNIFNSSSV